MISPHFRVIKQVLSVLVAELPDSLSADWGVARCLSDDATSTFDLRHPIKNVGPVAVLALGGRCKNNIAFRHS